MSRFPFALAALTALPAIAPPALAQKAVPVAGGSNFTLTTGGAALTVGTATSARVTSLKYQGAEMLYLNSSGGNILWGSTFWPSPQTNWTSACKSAGNASCWPPPAALDGNAYSGGLLAADTAVSYTGTVDPGTQLRFRKTFSASLKDSSFTLLYHMVNASSSPVTFAPWEDTRFPSGGITFWPTGSGAPTGNATMLKQTRDTLGVTWFAWDSSASLSGSTKIFADGGAAGWMAHVDKSRVLYIKKFADTPPSKKAPGVENECEIYITQALQEMELQGPYTSIPGNDSLAWEVKWYVRKLPDNIAIGRNKGLAEFTAQVIAGPTTGSAWKGNRSQNRSAVGIRAGLLGRSLALDLPQSMELAVSFFDARGRKRARIAAGRFAEGRTWLPLPEVCLNRRGWIVVRDIGTGTTLARMQSYLPG